jgi:hypothetical protein
MNAALDNALRDKTPAEEESFLVKRMFGNLIKMQYDTDGTREIKWDHCGRQFSIYQIARGWSKDRDRIAGQGPCYASYMREPIQMLYMRDGIKHRLDGPAVITAYDDFPLKRFMMNGHNSTFGSKQFYVNGKEFTSSEFNFFVKGIIAA